MKLALGTVQFGLNYGVGNSTGQVPSDEVSRILSIAKQAGINTLDTAIGYGQSEMIIGQAGVCDWRVVTKLPALPFDSVDVAEWVSQQVEGSLARLKIPCLDGLLLHRAADLLGPGGDALYVALQEIKQKNLCKKIGISVYGVEEIEQISQRYSIDLIQMPFNVFDRRLTSSGYLSHLKKQGIEVHVRSVFLQGLLLMQPSKYPAFFAPWQSLLKEWRSWLNEHSINPVTAALQFVLNHPEIDRVLVGVDSSAQLQEILSAADGSSPPIPDNLESQDINLINPSNWNIS